MYCIILYCTVLCFFVFYYIVVFCFVLYFIFFIGSYCIAVLETQSLRRLCISVEKSVVCSSLNF